MMKPADAESDRLLRCGCESRRAQMPAAPSRLVSPQLGDSETLRICGSVPLNIPWRTVCFGSKWPRLATLVPDRVSPQREQGLSTTLAHRSASSTSGVRKSTLQSALRERLT